MLPFEGPARRRRIGLIMPNSLCSGQVANLIAKNLEKESSSTSPGEARRYIALPHTEGCGCHAAESGDLAARTLLNYVLHPSVDSAIFLEHGCEKYQNTFFKDLLKQSQIPGERFGWASIQKDGGIRRAAAHISEWFSGHQDDPRGSLSPPIIGLLSSAPITALMAGSITVACRSILAAGGSLVVPATSTLLASPALISNLFSANAASATLPYGDAPDAPGFHIMDVPTDDELDILGGLGATGVEAIVACVERHPAQAHPFIPLIQVSESEGEDLDLTLQPGREPIQNAADVLKLIGKSISGEYVPKMLQKGLTAFQLSRGRLGISL